MNIMFNYLGLACLYHIQQSSTWGSIELPRAFSYSKKHSSMVTKSSNNGTFLKFSRTKFVLVENPINFPSDNFFFLKFTFGPKFFLRRPKKQDFLKIFACRYSYIYNISSAISRRINYKTFTALRCFPPHKFINVGNQIICFIMW